MNKDEMRKCNQLGVGWQRNGGKVRENEWHGEYVRTRVVVGPHRKRSIKGCQHELVEEAYLIVI